ncbi:MAG: hypothetical protein Q9O62_01750 [Ardenticatenia bacterium]|nr:hypothetical protein [Ardenticatenia bacterium]
MMVTSLQPERINDRTLFVGLTPKNVNLGMAFAEARTIAKQLADVLADFA